MGCQCPQGTAPLVPLGVPVPRPLGIQAAGHQPIDTNEIGLPHIALVQELGQVLPLGDKPIFKVHHCHHPLGLGQVMENPRFVGGEAGGFFQQ